MKPVAAGPAPAALIPGWPGLTAALAGCRLDVSVTHNARHTAADGLHGGALRVRLAALPVDGKAHVQLLGWLADELGCTQRAVTLLRGDTSRRKQLLIDLPQSQMAACLAKLVLPGAE